MNTPAVEGPTRSGPPKRKHLMWLGCVLAVPLGLKWGYDFGNQLNGPWLGLLTAANTALLCALLVDWLADCLPAQRG